jgi:hypothetical protein
LRPITIYRVLFGASIATNLPIALACVFVPDWFAYLVIGHWEVAWLGWARAWGGTLLGLHAVYLPGLWSPLTERWINWTQVGIKFGMAGGIFWLNPPGFFWFGVWDFTWGVVLLAAWANLLLADSIERDRVLG